MEDAVVGVQLDDGKEFVVDITGVTPTPHLAGDKFPLGARIKVLNPDKAYPKFDDLAKDMNLNKFAMGRKPLPNVVGTVMGSVVHPFNASVTVVAIRSDDNNADYLFDSAGLEVVTAASPSAEWPIGARVRVTNPDKVYTKMDDQAAKMALSKFTLGAKPKTGDCATILGTLPHPTDPNALILGIRVEGPAGRDFVFAPDGLSQPPPQKSEKFTAGARVRITSVDKLYTKMDEAATRLCLSNWTMGSKPPVKQVGITNPYATPAASSTKPKDGEAATTEEPEAKKAKVEVPEIILGAALGEVIGSEMHPDGVTMVVGVKTDAGPSFLVAEDGLQLIPNVGKEVNLGLGTRVRIDPLKVYPKNDVKALELGLPKWMNGAKPGSVVTGKVVSSCKK